MVLDSCRNLNELVAAKQDKHTFIAFYLAISFAPINFLGDCSFSWIGLARGGVLSCVRLRVYI